VIVSSRPNAGASCHRWCRRPSPAAAHLLVDQGDLSVAVAPGERPQERPQRGQGPDAAERIFYVTVPLSWHRAAGRPCHRCCPSQRPSPRPAGDLQVRVHADARSRPTRLPVLTCSPARSARPQRPATAITETTPARDTRFGSSNDAHVLAGSWAIEPARCPLQLDVGTFSNFHRSNSEGTFRVNPPECSLFARVDRG